MLMFDQNEDLLSVDVTNTGEGTAFNVSLGYYFGDASSDCNNETVETVMMLNSGTTIWRNSSVCSHRFRNVSRVWHYCWYHG